MAHTITLLAILAMIYRPSVQEAMAANTAGGHQIVIPESTGYTALDGPRMIKGHQDFKMWEFDRGQKCDPSKEYDSTVTTFILEDGASISNVIFGVKQISSVLCLGSCTLTNVWFREPCDGK